MEEGFFFHERHFQAQDLIVTYVRRSYSRQQTSIKNVLGRFSFFGTGPVVRGDGMMNSNIVVTRMVPELEKLVACVRKDLASPHASEKVKKLPDGKITCLEWLGNLPVLIPVENLWAICKVV